MHHSRPANCPAGERDKALALLVVSAFCNTRASKHAERVPIVCLSKLTQPAPHQHQTDSHTIHRSFALQLSSWTVGVTRMVHGERVRLVVVRRALGQFVQTHCRYIFSMFRGWSVAKCTNYMHCKCRVPLSSWTVSATRMVHGERVRLVVVRRALVQFVQKHCRYIFSMF